MTRHINIAIRNTDRYFAQGLEAVLLQYFTQKKGWEIIFLSEKYYAIAHLIFQGTNTNQHPQFCRQSSSFVRQKVITIQEPASRRYGHRNRPPCLSEQGVIHQHIEVKNLLREVERVLTQGTEAFHQGSCPRCRLALTQREMEVLSALREGCSLGKIAEQLKLSIKTVSSHKRKAMQKLGFTCNVELYRWLLLDALDNEIEVYGSISINKVAKR